MAIFLKFFDNENDPLINVIFIVLIIFSVYLIYSYLHEFIYNSIINEPETN